MRTAVYCLLLIVGPAFGQQPELPKLKQRDEVPVRRSDTPPADANGLRVVPAGTKIPIQLRQAVSTKNAQPGDPIYGQTTFPIVVDNLILIPAGTFVKGVVDVSKRAGRIKGKAELQFHITNLVYANGYTVDLAAAVDQVPGSEDAQIREPGKVTHDSEKGEDLKRIGQAAATGGQIGAVAGAASGSFRGVGVGGISGIAVGTLIAVLARGSDVRFDIGSGVEVSLNRAIAVDEEKAVRAGMIPASSAPAPVITAAPVVRVER